LKRIPVVVLSTSKAQEDVIRSYDLHANRYLTKPADLDQFLKVARSIEKRNRPNQRIPEGCEEGHPEHSAGGNQWQPDRGRWDTQDNRPPTCRASLSGKQRRPPGNGPAAKAGRVSPQGAAPLQGGRAQVH
jgi:DNA-binding response OmpR family regulator